MKLRDIYEKAVEIGIEADPRGRDVVLAELAREKKKFDELSSKDREFYEEERLRNPYADTRIVQGDPESEVRGVLVGVDMEVGEILLADRLREKGLPIDAVIAHHPEGRALAQFWEVMSMQADILHRLGIPVTTAEGLLAERMKEVSHRILPVNHSRAVDAARELGMPLVCIHTPADNLVATFLQRIFNDRKPERLGEVVELLLDIPEYRRAARESSGPTIVSGQKDQRCGRIFVDMTGGTEGSKDIFSRLAATQVGTIVCMHLSEDHLKEAEKNHLKVVVAGHIASDTVGLNLLLDRLAGPETLQIRGCSGFTRLGR
jgi:putative NIF3 family GTP cyclohydrolase 1 type 2